MEVKTEEQGDKLYVAFEYNQYKENKIRSTHALKLSELQSENSFGGKTYKLQRTAGTITFLPNNKFTFEENKNFQSNLETLLSSEVPSGLLLIMALGNTTFEDVQAIKAHKNNLNIKDLIAISSLGIKADYIKSIKTLGYEDIKISNIIAFKSLGIKADYISSIKSVGYKEIIVSDIITFKSMGIDAEWIKKINKENNTKLSTSELITLKLK